MQKFLTACALAALTATAAMAQPMQKSAIAAAVGQKIYDLKNMEIGVIQGETSETGTPSVIVARSNAAGTGDHQVLIAENTIQPKIDGGWLASLDANSVSQLRPYVPGKMGPD